MVKKRDPFLSKSINNSGIVASKVRNRRPYLLFSLMIITLVMVLATGCITGRRTLVRDRFTENSSGKAKQAGDESGIWFKTGELKMEDWEYAPNIKSVKLYRQDIELSMPVMELGDTDRLQLIFDDLDGYYKEYRYMVIHCDAFWEPSNLFPEDYIEVFTEGLITQYAFSQATRQPYVHYNCLIPDENMKLTKSGNYVIMVYDARDRNRVILTRRFMIYEPGVKVKAWVKRSSVVEDLKYKQEIDFEIDRGTYPIENPYTELKVFIQQNGRLDNLIRDIEPKLVLGNKLSYDWDRINVFDGTNEFRHVDLRSLSRLTPRVAMIERDSLYHHVYVMPDYKRAFQVYIEDKDLNGEYIIMNEDALSNHYTEADYAWVHFTFPVNNPYEQGAVYLLGAMTNWQFIPEARMVYSKEKHTYETTLYLKQGYYNYLYVLLGNATTMAGTFLTEGDHFETENFYTIWVYYRKPGNYYDQLIAVERIIAPQPR